ncbi:hypothetical protein BC628DRAFT_665187 [Trametes gibbosa]|nr:hypothetical protein BC628DRAFT_665187 [Trametes gibbosa]
MIRATPLRFAPRYSWLPAACMYVFYSGLSYACLRLSSRPLSLESVLLVLLHRRTLQPRAPRGQNPSAGLAYERSAPRLARSRSSLPSIPRSCTPALSAASSLLLCCTSPAPHIRPRSPIPFDIPRAQSQARPRPVHVIKTGLRIRQFGLNQPPPHPIPSQPPPPPRPAGTAHAIHLGPGAAATGNSRPPLPMPSIATCRRLYPSRAEPRLFLPRCHLYLHSSSSPPRACQSCVPDMPAVRARAGEWAEGERGARGRKDAGEASLTKTKGKNTKWQKMETKKRPGSGRRHHHRHHQARPAAGGCAARDALRPVRACVRCPRVRAPCVPLPVKAKKKEEEETEACESESEGEGEGGLLGERSARRWLAGGCRGVRRTQREALRPSIASRFSIASDNDSRGEARRGRVRARRRRSSGEREGHDEDDDGGGGGGGPGAGGVR